MSILFLDLETTGTDPLKHTVIEIYAEYHSQRSVVSNFHAKIQQQPNPDNYVDLGAMRINNTSLLDMWSNTETELVTVAKFTQWLLSLNQTRLHLCGHNINFDINFLKILFSRCRVEGWDSIFARRVEDTAILATTLQKCGILPSGSLSLANLATMLEVPVSDCDVFHTAKLDTEITAAIYYKLVDKLNNLGPKQDGKDNTK